MKNQSVELFHHHKLNPILTSDNRQYFINRVVNAGAALLPGRDY